jgi:hypothetical protein
MKYLFLLLISLPSFACMNSISPSDLKKVVESGSYQVAETLTYRGVDAVCIDDKNLLEHDLIDGELIYNSDKAFAKENSEKAARDAEIVKRDKCKSFSFKGKTIAELRQELNESLECK